MSMMSPDARQEVLAGLEFFSGCSDRQLREIAQLADERSLPEGADLCHQGAFEEEIFVIVDGEADVIIDGASVRRTRIGEIVGELAMLGSGRRTATLRTLTPMRVLVLDPREIDSVLAADPSSARRLSRHDSQEVEG